MTINVMKSKGREKQPETWKEEKRNSIEGTENGDCNKQNRSNIKIGREKVEQMSSFKYVECTVGENIKYEK